MKKIFTIISLAISLFTNSQTLKNDTIISQKSSSFGLYVPGTPVIRLRCQSTVSSCNPLFIVDGIPIESYELKNLNPSDIVRIDIIKDAEAMALWGDRGVHGVIYITTKTTNQRTIIVKDFLDGNLLPASTVEITLKEKPKESFSLVTDSAGQIVTNKIIYGKEYLIRAANANYKPYSVKLHSSEIGKSYTLYLVKKIETTNPDEFRVFPNPAQRTQSIFINYDNVKSGSFTIRLLGFDGKLVDAKKVAATEGFNKFNFPLNGKLSAGVYLLQLSDEVNNLLKTEKLIIQ